MSSNLAHGEGLNLSVNCDRAVFLIVLRFPPDRHDITEILLKVALNTITKFITRYILGMYMYNRQ